MSRRFERPLTDKELEEILACSDSEFEPSDFDEESEEVIVTNYSMKFDYKCVHSHVGSASART